MTDKEKARAFSNGEFETVLNFIAEDAVWTIMEENTFSGKKAIGQNCEQVASYFKTVTTKFETLNIIGEDKKVAVNGTAEFFKNGKSVSFISACDLYEFNEKNEIQTITSYCIPRIEKN